MPALGAGIHDFKGKKAWLAGKDLDGRAKPGHDGGKAAFIHILLFSHDKNSWEVSLRPPRNSRRFA